MSVDEDHGDDDGDDDGDEMFSWLKFIFVKLQEKLFKTPTKSNWFFHTKEMLDTCRPSHLLTFGIEPTKWG